MTRERTLEVYRKATAALVRYRETCGYLATDAQEDEYGQIRRMAVNTAVALADANRAAGLPWHTDAVCG